MSMYTIEQFTYWLLFH